MSLYRRIKLAWKVAQHQPWVDEPEWTAGDAKALEIYLNSESGIKLLASLRNTNLRQQEKSLSAGVGLQYEAGYCTGQRSVIGFIQGMSIPKEFTEDGDHDADQPTN